MNGVRAVAALALLLFAVGGAAQQAGITRVIVHKADVAAPGHEAVVVRAELAPGAMAGRHSHPGDEISYVLEGEAELLIDGAAPRRVRAGEALVVPAGVIHDARNSGTTPLRLIGVYVLEKGKPLASAAPPVP